MVQDRKAGTRDVHPRNARRLISRVALAAGVVFLSIGLLDGRKVFAVDAEAEGWSDHLPFDVSGRYRIDYRGRWNTDDSEDDHQLFQYLNLRLDNIVPDKVSLRFSGRLSAELDGNDDGDDFFADIYDAFDHSLNGKIYYLYLDIKEPLFKDSNLRLGRQYSYEPKSLLFTGGKYEQTVNKLRFYVQGGVRGSHYTSPEEDDLVGGIGVDYRLLPRTHVGYDYLRVEDDSLDDDYHSFDILQRFGGLTTYAQFSVLNGDADDLNLYSSYYHAPLDLSLTARYFALLTQRDTLTNEFSALLDVDDFDADDPRTLAVYFPFHLVNLTAYKGWGERFATSVGFEARRMHDNDEKNDFNREYERYFVSLEIGDFFVNGLTTSLTLEYWDVDPSEDSFSIGIDAEKDITERLNVAVGFYYSEYRLRSTFSGTTFSEDIETPSLYGKLTYKLTEDVELLARYEIEDEDDLGTTHELHLGCSIGF
jgi:hypothetical protein